MVQPFDETTTIRLLVCCHVYDIPYALSSSFLPQMSALPVFIKNRTSPPTKQKTRFPVTCEAQLVNTSPKLQLGPPGFSITCFLCCLNALYARLEVCQACTYVLFCFFLGFERVIGFSLMFRDNNCGLKTTVPMFVVQCSRSILLFCSGQLSEYSQYSQICFHSRSPRRVSFMKPISYFVLNVRGT